MSKTVRIGLWYGSLKINRKLYVANESVSVTRASRSLKGVTGGANFPVLYGIVEFNVPLE